MPKETDANEALITAMLLGESSTGKSASTSDVDNEFNELRKEILRDQVARIRAKRQNDKDQAQTKEQALRYYLAQREAVQKNCNHRKGGEGGPAVVRGEGDDDERCIAKHRLPIGKWMVLCLRCGKEWHDANPYNVENGKVKPKPATPGFDEAIRWPTKNKSSLSSTFLIERDPNIIAAQ